MCILNHMQSTFFCLEKFLKKLADNECSSVAKGSIYYIKHMYIQLFSMEVDWPEIWGLLEVSTIFYICRYRVLTLWVDLRVDTSSSQQKSQLKARNDRAKSIVTYVYQVLHYRKVETICNQTGPENEHIGQRSLAISIHELLGKFPIPLNLHKPSRNWGGRK